MSEFLAEARVLVTPDTTKFRALLEAQLAAATTKPLIVPVQAAVVGPVKASSQLALNSALSEQRVIQEQLAASTVKATATANAQTRAQTANAAAATKLAFAEAAVVDAASAVSAAQITATRSTAALAEANRAVGIALTSQDPALIKVARDTLALAKAQSIAASAALANARAQASSAATLAQVGKAASASGAGILGLRGAVLTAGGAFLAATVGIQAFSKAVSGAASLQSELNVFRVTAGATADEMERVSDTAAALGRDLSLPGVTATDATQAFLALSRAGLSVQDSLDGARGVLQLAVAAQIGFADAAQLTASALNAFALEGDQAINVADLLTNAANQSQASIADMGIALRQSAAIADLVGFSLSETVTFLTQLAQAGLSGSDAGTSFRVAMQRLIAPTGAARKELQGLNVNLRDAAGNLRPEAFFELGDALERMSRAQADATRQTIFGNDASRAAAFFARINAEAFRDQERSLSRAGAAAEVAGARNAGFAGSVENLKNQIAALGIEIGQLALPVLGASADATSLFFGALATSIDETSKSLGTFEDDANQLQTALTELSEESGFTDFVKGVAEGARLIEGDIERAEGAIGDLSRSLFGGGEAAAETTPKIIALTEEEKRLAEAIHDAVRPTVEQTSSLNELTSAAARAAQAVKNLQGQEAGLEEQTTRARIAGDEQAELASLRERRAKLEAELAAQERLIARPGEAGDATARLAIRQRILPQLEAVNNEIDNIIAEQQSRTESLQREREQAQQDAIRTRNEADREFLNALSQRREDAGNRITAAAATEGAADDIRAQNALQALIKKQIAKVRDLITDEQARKGAIRELRLALIASRREEDALRAQQRADIAARRQEGIELDISFAETTENVGREVNARLRLIALLRKQQAAVKKGTNEWKRLRNEIAEQQQAIKETQEQAQQNDQQGQSAQQFFFEQLQAQQGFASNLLGNLIPRDQTAGLVGVPSPTGGTSPQLGAAISAAAGAAAGKQGGGVTAGQANTTNDILLRILEQLRHLNDDREHPEATRQRRNQMAVMDFEHGQGGVM